MKLINKLSKEDSEILEAQMYRPLAFVYACALIAVALTVLCAILSGVFGTSLKTSLIFIWGGYGIVFIRSFLLTLSRFMYAYFDWYAIPLEWVRFPGVKRRFKKELKKTPSIYLLEQKLKAMEDLKEGYRPGFDKFFNIMLVLVHREINDRMTRAEKAGRKAYIEGINRRRN